MKFSILFNYLPLALSFVSACSAFEFVGLWEGIDPLDGAQMQRSFVPAGGSPTNFTVVGRIEHSQICGSDTSGNITEEPDATELLIPAHLNGYGEYMMLDEESSDGTSEGVQASLALTCVGEDSVRIPAIPVAFVPVSETVLMEVPAFRAESPIYLFRISALPMPATPSTPVASKSDNEETEMKATSGASAKSFGLAALFVTGLSGILSFY